MKKEKMIRTSMNLSADDLNRLREKTRREDRSMAQGFRLALREYVNKPENV